jgi:mono/diheme cytochrome c family protein
MTTQALNQILQRLIKQGSLTLVFRSIEIFGWIDLVLGLFILITPAFTAAIFHLPPLSPLDISLLRIVGALVTTIGTLYVINARFNSLGFAVASLLDRPLVPLIMAWLWYKRILPGPLAASFSIVDFGGFLLTAFAWRADLRCGRNVGGPALPGQTRAARSAEVFGWLSIVIGSVTLLFPVFTASLLKISSAGFPLGANYLQLMGLLVGGLGMLFVVGASLDTGDFVTASVSVQMIAPLLIALAWWVAGIPRGVALAFIGSSLAGGFWTLLAARADIRSGNEMQRVPFFAQCVSALFAYLSGVVRNSRVFHPDGRVFLGTVQRYGADAAGDLSGFVLMRIGMGVMKRGMPAWLAHLIPDAPSIASRFFTVSEAESVSQAALHLSQIPMRLRPGQDLDLLATAGGDRLWKLVWNLASGGTKYGLKPFDYFANTYYADVPYRIAVEGTAVWIRLKYHSETAEASELPNGERNVAGDANAREQALTDACAAHALLHIEVQPVDSSTTSFEPIATIQFEKELDVDQEALHFYPFSGRGFEPYGFFTGLRRSVYPASVQSRPHDRLERAQREHHPFRRFIRYWREIPTGPIAIQEGRTAMVAPSEPENQPDGKRRWVRLALFAVVITAVISGFYLIERFTRNSPVDYTDEVTFFERGSTGGERMNGIPYWIWITLPEIFPEQLPDHRTGQGYAAFGMIYEPRDKGNPYALPLGISRRNVRGLDVVYLNCAACHTGTVRDTPGAEPHIYPGMPAHQFDLGAWGRFLTTIPKDQKFTPQRILDQIDRMQDDPRRLVPKLDFINRLILRYYAIYLMRDQLITLGQRLSFIDNSTWGPGRVDTFNAPKALLNFPMEHADRKELMGNCDFPSVWNQQARKGMHLHWDGNNTSVDERNLSAAFGTGAYPPTLDSARVLRMAKYLETAQPPPYPYPIDQALANKGKPIYGKLCMSCHGTRKPPFRTTPLGESESCDYMASGAQCVGTVVPLDEIGTDPSRFNSYTWLLAVNQSTLYAGYEEDWGFNPPYPQRFHLFRKTHGYANMPLDGIWLRAPYLHNGSVPTLNDLLKPSSDRTSKFFRGNDVFDRENVGFVSNVPEENGHKYFLFDTSKVGNGNKGHEGKEYGTELPTDQKRALLEYLKNF